MPRNAFIIAAVRYDAGAVKRMLSMFVGTVVAIGLLLLSLLAWFEGANLALASDQPVTLWWAARAFAVASAAGAHIIVLSFVVSWTYRNRDLCEALRLTAALVCCVAAVTAAALGLAASE